MFDPEIVLWWLRAICMTTYAVLFLIMLPFSIWSERYRPTWYRRLPEWLQ